MAIFKIGAIMKVTVTEIMVDSSNKFEGIVNEIETTNKKEGSSMTFDGSYKVHSIEFINENEILIYVIT